VEHEGGYESGSELTRRQYPAHLPLHTLWRAYEKVDTRLFGRHVAWRRTELSPLRFLVDHGFCNRALGIDVGADLRSSVGGSELRSGDNDRDVQAGDGERDSGGDGDESSIMESTDDPESKSESESDPKALCSSVDSLFGSPSLLPSSTWSSSSLSLSLLSAF